MNIQQLRELENGREPTAWELVECAVCSVAAGIGILVLLALPVVRYMQEVG